MLNTYLSRTERLLQNPAAPVALYSAADLTDYINQARGQVAGEGRCVRAAGAISTAVGQRAYDFTSINTGVPATTGIRGVINVRSILFAIASGQQWVRPRPWPWFQLYKLNNPVPDEGLPEVWSQFEQGVTGSFYLDPIPDQIVAMTPDCACYPIDLVDDTTVEALPYYWTDAVAYYAAYLALLSAQAAARQADANRMFERYSEFMGRARQFSNPDVNTYLYEQAGDPAQVNKFAIQGQGGGRQGAA